MSVAASLRAPQRFRGLILVYPAEKESLEEEEGKEPFDHAVEELENAISEAGSATMMTALYAHMLQAIKSMDRQRCSDLQRGWARAAFSYDWPRLEHHPVPTLAWVDPLAGAHAPEIGHRMAEVMPDATCCEVLADNPMAALGELFAFLERVH